MFLEKGILSVHMGAIEKSVSIDNIVPVVFTNIVRVIIFLVLYVVFVTLDVLADYLTCGG